MLLVKRLFENAITLRSAKLMVTLTVPLKNKLIKLVAQKSMRPVGSIDENRSLKYLQLVCQMRIEGIELELKVTIREML